jgi:hypothetical protein
MDGSFGLKMIAAPDRGARGAESRRGALPWLRVLAAVVTTSGVCAAGQIELPADPRRELVYDRCQACHDLGNLIGAAGLSRDDWNGVLDQMKGNGLQVTEQERADILDYLATYLGSAAAKQGEASQ